jgi:hypothetical protein
MVPSVTESAVNTALGNLLQAMLPQFAAGQIVVGQTNRVASPEGDYLVFWPLRRPRLGTDIETPVDAVFTGTITPIDANTATLDITAVNPNFSGELSIGSVIFGVNVASNTTVTALGTGTGGIGTYIVKPSQTIGSETLSAGVIDIDQSTEIVFQIDCHGPSSGDTAQVISTLFRSSFATTYCAQNSPIISPLYCADPRQMVFTTAAQQFDERYIVEAHLQIVPVIAIPQEFAAAATVDVVNVEATYPE